jgi:polar amino acid transport system substrate-binding protein
MSMKKLTLVVLSIVLAGAFLFSGCGSSATKVLRVGLDDTYPPMEYKDEAGNFAGFDIEMSKEIGKRLGVEVQYVPTAWTAIFNGLSADKYDCIISSLSITEDRKKSLDYTRPYISNNQVIAVKIDNSTIASEKDLKDKIVAVQMGTTSEEACNEFTKTTPFKDFKKYEAMTEALSELKIGRVDAVVCDLVVGKYFVAKDKTSYKLVSTTLPLEPIGIGLKKGDTEMTQKIDKILGDMISDGTLKNISTKWFGEDMTGNLGK